MGKVIYITGGARSGKSSYAEELLEGKKNVLYVATAIAFDEEMKDRIKKHRDRRSDSWTTLEEYKNFDSKLLSEVSNKDYILFDCITVMISNIMVLDNDCDWDNITVDRAGQIENEVLNEIDSLLEVISDFNGTSILVSNELGMGIVPGNPLGRIFRDIAGRVNQKIANISNEAYLVVSGVPVKIK